jgi:4-amino-4-deoxy-L-arabinose transferase-like glycosyltransferase
MSRWLVAAGIVGILVTAFAALGSHPLCEPDEARYAEIPREMLERHDWVTPHLNYVKYFEKPPLIYWLNALTFTTLGTSDLLARMWPSLFGLAGVAVAYVLGRAIYGPWVGCAAAALLAATPFHFGLSQFLTLDMPLSTSMAAGLTAFWLAYAGRQPRWAFVLTMYVMIGVAVLIKGPVAVVLSAGAICGFLVLRWDFAALTWLVTPLGIAAFLAVVAPWFVLVSRRNPEFLRFFIIDQHIGRFLWTHEHFQPLWYYVPILLVGTLPWSGFVLLAPRLTGRSLARILTRRAAPGTLFLVTWCVVIFTFFSLSRSKVGTYVLPICPPLAVLAARFFEQVLQRRDDAVLRRGYLLVLVIGGLGAIWALLTPLAVDDWRITLVASYVLPSGCVLVAAAVGALWLVSRGARLASLAVLWTGILLMQVVVINARAVSTSYSALGKAIRSAARPDDLVVGYREYTQGTTYYAARRVVLVANHGELDFGRGIGDQSAFFWDADADLLQAWASKHRLFLIIDRSALERLRSRMQPPPRQVAAEGRKLVVVNFADDVHR